MLSEDREELKDLANKSPDQELELADANDIGREIANIDDEEERQRFLTMVRSLGRYPSEDKEKMATIRNDALDAYKEERADIEESLYKRLTRMLLGGS